MRGWIVIAAAVAGLGCGGSDSADSADAAIDAQGPIVDSGPADARLPTGQCVANPGPAPGRHQYIVDRYIVPTNATEAAQLSLDIDGDNLSRPDNALGNIVSALAQAGGGDVDLQADVDAAFATGDIIELVELATSDLSNSSGASLRWLQGLDCDSPPDPADNFSGSEAFAVRPDAALDSIVSGEIVSSAFDLGPGSLTIELVLYGGEAQLPLVGARAIGTVSADAVTNGVLGGALRQSDVDAIIVPAIADGMQATVAGDCLGTPPNCCADENSTGATLLGLFDADPADCQISADEIRQSAIISSLLAPDLDLFDGSGAFAPNSDGINDSLSIGLGFSAVGARFEGF